MAKFNPALSPTCNICNMVVSGDIPHFVLNCPYINGAYQFALLFWSNNTYHTIYNMFLSAFQHWPCNKLINPLLDPLSQFDDIQFAPIVVSLLWIELSNISIY